jgi:hypothetical protein
MPHGGQIQEHAEFDGHFLELHGSTPQHDPGAHTILTIQVGVVQSYENDADPPQLVVIAAGYGTFGDTPGVKSSRVDDPKWEVRVKGAFDADRPATAFGTQIEFNDKRGAFETFTWAQHITIDRVDALKADVD